MATHDYNIANADGATVRADINNALSAILSRNSNATGPSTTVAHMIWIDTTAGVVKRRNAANTGWIIESTIDEARVVDRSSNTILDVSDIGKTFRATASFTQTIDNASTLGDGWFARYRVESGVSLTLDPNASEQIDGATTKLISGPASGMIFCNGSAFYTVGFPGCDAGTFTPKLQDTSLSDGEGVTYTTQVGWHRKIGGICFFGGILTTSGVGTLSTALVLAGLPFTSKNTANHFGGLYVGDAAGLAITAGQSVLGYIDPNTTYAFLKLWDSTAGTTGLLPAEWSADGSITFFGFYQVD